MEEDGAITSARAFLLRAKIFGSDAPIKAGEYRIPAHASNRDILNILQSGKVIARLVTIPEGMPSILVYEKLMAAKYLTGDVRVPLEGTVLPDSYSYDRRSEEHTSELQSLMRISYAVFCLKKKKKHT